METAKMTKQMFDFQKTTFDNSFNAMVMLQDQTEKMARMAFDRTPWMPEETRKAVDGWVSAYKKGRDDFKKRVDENYKKVEKYFNETEKKAPAKSKESE